MSNDTMTEMMSDANMAIIPVTPYLIDIILAGVFGLMAFVTIAFIFWANKEDNQQLQLKFLFIYYIFCLLY